VKVLLAARDCVTPPVRAPPRRCHEFVKLSSIFEFKLLIAPLFYYYARSLTESISAIGGGVLSAKPAVNYFARFDRFFVEDFERETKSALCLLNLLCIILRK
jgi:hypothetical protein